MVANANSSARSVDERIKQVTVSYGDCPNVTIANSEGLLVEDERIVRVY